MGNIFKITSFFFLSTAVATLISCSDSEDSSSPTGDASDFPEESSSSSLNQTSLDTESSGDAADVGSSSSESAVVGESSADGFVYKVPSSEELAQDLEYAKNSAITDFVDIKTVYENLASDEKVAFVIRHGKRESGTGVESQLTEAGIEQSQRLGASLASDEIFAYGHTDFVRTRATAENIAIGRGETEEFKSIVIPQLVASIYIKDQALFDQYKADSTDYKNEGQVYSKWAFDGSFLDAFNDLNTCAVQSITQVIVPNMSTEHRVNIFVSHDNFLMPLMIYVSQRNIPRLQYHISGKGIYYLEGIAVVVKNNGDRRYYVVNGIDFGS